MRHWLSYAHSDQALLRDQELDVTWDALVVPGTLAAFYFEGTGGFVLSKGRPYVIDPRTPLLQTIDVSRSAPKKSHLALAEIHDPSVPSFWPEREVPLGYWQDGRWPDVVRRVIDFQERYSSSATAKIDRYVKLLEEATGRTAPARPDPPHRIVPPYWAVTGQDDPWWALSREAIEVAVQECGGSRLLPVIATTRETPVATFADLVRDLPSECTGAFCWRGSWVEAEATHADIAGWADAIAAARESNVEIRNMYGGYLSVLLTAVGLHGVNHGIGYSEQRDVRRLGDTGAPPTRYYVPALRSFESRASAQPVVDSLPTEWVCSCPVCAAVTQGGVPIIDALSVEDLKRHFLICRHREFLRANANPEAELDELAT